MQTLILCRPSEGHYMKLLGHNFIKSCLSKKKQILVSGISKERKNPKVPKLWKHIN